MLTNFYWNANVFFLLECLRTHARQTHIKVLLFFWPPEPSCVRNTNLFK